MKESSGELSMTVITIIGVIAIGGLITAFVLPTVRNWITTTFNNIGNPDTCTKWNDDGTCAE